MGQTFTTLPGEISDRLINGRICLGTPTGENRREPGKRKTPLQRFRSLWKGDVTGISIISIGKWQRLETADNNWNLCVRFFTRHPLRLLLRLLLFQQHWRTADLPFTILFCNVLNNWAKKRGELEEGVKIEVNSSEWPSLTQFKTTFCELNKIANNKNSVGFEF